MRKGAFYFYFVLFLITLTYSPAQIAIVVRAFTVSEFRQATRSWSQGHGHKVMVTRSWPQGHGHGHKRCLSLSPPRVLAFVFFEHLGFSIPTFQFFYARRFASNFTNSRSHAFRLSICKKASLVKIRTSTSIVTRLTIGPPGTPAITLTSTKNRSRISCFSVNLARPVFIIAMFRIINTTDVMHSFFFFFRSS